MISLMDETSENLVAFRKGTASGFEVLPVFLTPLVISRQELAVFERVAVVVEQALRRLVELWLHKPDLRQRVPVSDRILELLSYESGYSSVLNITRFDAIYDSMTRRLKLIECNAGDPSGMGYNDMLVSALELLPAYQKLKARLGLATRRLVPSLRDALLATYNEFCRNTGRKFDKAPAIGMMVAKNSVVENDHQWMASILNDMGADAEVVDPREIELGENGAYARSRSFELLFRDTIDELSLGCFWNDTSNLRQAISQKHICMVNPVSASIGDKKSLFSFLSDPAYFGLYSSSTAQLLRDCIPWTRMLVPRNVEISGAKRDLFEYTRAKRELLVLKPTDGYGGHGVHIGYETTSSVWESILNAAYNEPGTWVAQERIPVAPIELGKVGSDGTIDVGPRYVTWSLWVHRGRFAGTFARGSNKVVTNLHQGGGMVVTCFT